MSKKFIFAIIITIITTAVIVGGGVYYWQKLSFEKEKNLVLQDVTNLQSEIQNLRDQIEILNETNDWNLYESSDFLFSIKYPKSWMFEESRGGLVTFWPSEDAVEPGREPICVYLHSGGWCDDIDFETCVRIAGAECFPEYVGVERMCGGLGWEGYDKINTLEEVVTLSGMVGYKTTWVVEKFLTRGEYYISSPMTFFDARGKVFEAYDKVIPIGYFIIDVDEPKYTDLYEKMIRTFNFVDKKK